MCSCVKDTEHLVSLTDLGSGHIMTGFGLGQEEESPELSTPAAIKEQLNSHPLDVDSGSEASFASALDNQGDSETSPGVPRASRPPQSPNRQTNTEQRVKQQASSQTADFIASHTPTSLGQAQLTGAHLQSIARDVAIAATKRLNEMSRETEATSEWDQSSVISQAIKDVQASMDNRQSKGPNMPIRPTGSLADITNSTYDNHTHVTKKATSHNAPESPVGPIEQTTAAETKGHLTSLLDWTVSTLYYSSGVAVGIAEGTARGVRARH